jgi:hypothetical protein
VHLRAGGGRQAEEKGRGGGATRLLLLLLLRPGTMSEELQCARGQMSEGLPRMSNHHQ